MLIEINNLEVCIIGILLTMAPTVACSVIRLIEINILLIKLNYYYMEKKM